MPIRPIATAGILFGATLVASAVMAADAERAEAHQMCQHLTRNWSCVSVLHTRISVHDEECDDRRTYVYYATARAPRVVHQLTDHNGCNAGGAYSDEASGVIGSKLCEFYWRTGSEVCGPWTPVR